MGMSVATKTETLDSILAMKEPKRTERLQQWVDEFDDQHSGEVLIRAHNRKPVNIRLANGKTFHISPQGRRMNRKEAIPALMRYGINGQYTGKDQRTGLSRTAYENMNPEGKAIYKGYKFDFFDDYLVHVPDGEAEEEETEEQE
jgi:hypothetical protein